MDTTGTALRHFLQFTGTTTSERLKNIHDRILDNVPGVDRIACVLYDPRTDMLKTFVNSTRHGNPINAYEFKLSDSRSLSKLADSGDNRVLDELVESVHPTSPHSRWLLEQGYRSSFTVPMYNQGEFIGFVFFNSVQPAYFAPTVQRDLVLYCNLINMLISSERQAVQFLIASAQIASDFAELRDFETGAHLARMALYARLIARHVAKKHGLSDETIEHIYLFAPLHDIGKIGIPDGILLKKGPLDPDELKAMRTHVDKGREIIEKVLGKFNVQNMSDSSVMLNIVAFHHEMLDGSGYPRARNRDEVPIEARITTVADIFDALTSRRPYKNRWTIEDAYTELDRMVVNGKIDGDCVDALKVRRDAVEEIMAKYPGP